MVAAEIAKERHENVMKRRQTTTIYFNYEKMIPRNYYITLILLPQLGESFCVAISAVWGDYISSSSSSSSL